MSSQLSRLYTTEISRLQKVEWLEHYIKARAITITSRNILAGWRGAGLFPTNPYRVLRSLSDNLSTPLHLNPSEDASTPSLLVNSSPPDAEVLCAANSAFNAALQDAALSTPIRKHGKRLSGIAEHLHADNSILRRENTELKSVISKRKERMSGKRVTLKGKIIVSTEEVQQKLAQLERNTQVKKVRSRKKKCPTQRPAFDTDEEDIDDESEIGGDQIQDCIEVELR
jgi:hypothetical protein